MYSYLLIIFLILILTVYFFLREKGRLWNSPLYLFSAAIITAMPAVLVAHFFALWGIWQYNPGFNAGFHVLLLPVEEILFLITAPAAFIMAYEWLATRPEWVLRHRRSVVLSWLLVCLFAATAWVFRDLVYTALVSVFAVVLLLQHLLVFRRRHYGRFYTAFMTTLLPFLLLRGIITWLPAVTFHPEHITGLKIISTPLEDVAAFFVMMFFATGVYEWNKRKRVTVNSEQ